MVNRFTAISAVLPWAIDLGAILTTVEYRLAPEHPDPAPVEDCYAALVWISDHADELGIDATRILVTGNSAGGGLAAGISLVARDRRGPAILGQPPPAPLTSPACPRPTSMSRPRRFFGMKMWPWRRKFGPTAVSPSCTCGHAAHMGFELLASQSRITQQAARTRNSWLRDMFDGGSTARSEMAG
jgi:alpha/beta hydrolase fold